MLGFLTTLDMYNILNRRIDKETDEMVFGDDTYLFYEEESFIEKVGLDVTNLLL